MLYNTANDETNGQQTNYCNARCKSGQAMASGKPKITLESNEY